MPVSSVAPIALAIGTPCVLGLLGFRSAGKERTYGRDHLTGPVAIVGGGAAGLATAAMLRREGVSSVVLEAADEIGKSWLARYDRLRLHTPRLLSCLPGYRIPRRHGRWVARDGVVDYLREYARVHELDVRLGARVERIDREGDAWSLSTGGEVVPAAHVVVATGYSRIPLLPDWPGLSGYRGEVSHSAGYRNAEPYRGREVLVVGTGNSGAEIAVDLADGAAARVAVAVRTPPHIARRDSLGIPAQAVGIALGHLPPKWAGALAAGLRRLTIPDLEPYGLPRPTEPLGEQFARTGTIPILDVGFVDALRRGRVVCVAAVAGFEEDAVVLADGSRARVDAVLAATGFVPGLEPLVGHLGVLDRRGLPRTDEPAPGLHFIGFRPTLGGMLRRAAIDSQLLARRIAAGAMCADSETSGAPRRLSLRDAERRHGGSREAGG
jgi:putative flavoprotein involved in K+ transport